MITLITTDAASRFDTGALEKPLDDVREAVDHLVEWIVTQSEKLPDQVFQPMSQPTLAENSRPTLEPTTEEAMAFDKSLARRPGYHVLVMSQSGEVVAPESLKVDDQNPIVACIRRLLSDAPVGSLERAMAVTGNPIKAYECFCNGDCWLSHLVVIMDADFYFYPERQPGAFTQTLDNDTALMELIDTIGSYLAGYDGHLFLVAGLLQDPERLLESVRKHGWSWVWHHDGRFEVVHGTAKRDMPEILADYCLQHEPMSEAKLAMDRTPMPCEVAVIPEDRYIFRREGDVWHLRFQEERSSFPHSVNFETLAKLLNEPGRKMDALELMAEDRDTERETAARDSQSVDYSQSGRPIDATDPKAIRAVANDIMSRLSNIWTLCDEADTERMARIEEEMTILKEDHDYLNKGTRDKAKMVNGCPRLTGEADGATGPMTGKPAKNRIDDLMAQLQEACDENDIEKIREWTRELINCYDPNQPRRPRQDDLELMESARKCAHIRLDRAKKTIRHAMPHCGQHLEENVVGVRGEPKWVYNADIHWKVDSSKP